MLRKTQTNLVMQGGFAGPRYMLAAIFTPGLLRDMLAVKNATNVERGIRLHTALKANKVDIRDMLALPVTDPAHPYKSEFAWEKVLARMDARNLTGYGRWYRLKIMATYEQLQFHKWGCYQDDLINARGWWNRAARTRMPGQLVIHMDRRVYRARSLKDKYLYDKKENWVKPSDNTPFMSPYISMVCDEWEEKWGFFAGQEVEF